MGIGSWGVRFGEGLGREGGCLLEFFVFYFDSELFSFVRVYVVLFRGVVERRVLLGVRGY